MTLEPTPQLRFVERTHAMLNASYPDTVRTTKIRILQQWWRDVQTGEGEWRDVQLEAE